MIDLTLRMDYADVFDFDKFHEAFRQMLASAKGDECIKLESWIESRPDLWKDYDLTLSSKIASVLEVEVYDQYELSSDPDDNIFIPKAKKEEPHKQPVQTIRGLVKDFLPSWRATETARHPCLCEFAQQETDNEKKSSIFIVPGQRSFHPL